MEEFISTSSSKPLMKNSKQLLDEDLIQSERLLELKKRDTEMLKNKNSKE